MLNAKRVPTCSAWTFLVLHLQLSRGLLARRTPHVTEMLWHLKSLFTRVPEVLLGNFPPFCYCGEKQVFNWDPEQLQRLLVDDSVFAPGCENSIDFVLVGNRCYQPGCCT